MADYKFVVFTSPAEGQEDAYNRWYSEVHLGEVCAVPGVTGAKRFRLVATGEAAPRHRYLAIYEISADDPKTVLAEINRRAGSGEMQMSDALDRSAETMLFEAI